MPKIKNRITNNTIIPTNIGINNTGATYNLPEVVVTPQNNSRTTKLSVKDIKDRELLIRNINRGQEIGGKIGAIGMVTGITPSMLSVSGLGQVINVGGKLTDAYSIATNPLDPLNYVPFDKIIKTIGRGVKNVFRNKKITLENVNKITDKQWDKAYYKAISSGDLLEAQRLRDLHFIAKAPGTKLVNNNGIPISQYHTVGNRYDSSFNEFNPNIEGNNSAVYTTDNKIMSSSYATKAEENNKIKELYVNAENPMIVDAKNNLWKNIPFDKHITARDVYEEALKHYHETQYPNWQKYAEDQAKKILKKHNLELPAKDNSISFFGYDTINDRLERGLKNSNLSKEEIANIVNKYNEDIYSKMPLEPEIEMFSNKDGVVTTRFIERLAKKKGYDSVIINNVSDWGSHGLVGDKHKVRQYNQVVEVMNPNNLKYRAVQTFDDNGILIPLSKRDNFNIKDLRYSIAPISGISLYQSNEKSMGGNTLIKNGKPNVIRGGSAKQFAPGLFYMQGRSHAKGGIDIGRNPKTGVEVEGGEVVQLGKGGMRVFSAQPFLTGQSPANLVASGANPDVVFAAQENFKDRFGINDDGTMAQTGGLYKPGTIYGRPVEKGLEIVSPEFDILSLGRLIGSSVGKSAVSGLQNLPTAKERIAATNKAFKETTGAYKSAMRASGEDIVEGIKDRNIKYVYDGMRDAVRGTGTYINYLIDTPTRYLNNYLESKSRPYARMIKFNYNNFKNLLPSEFLDDKNEKKMGGIHIDKNKRGTFTTAATKHGMGVQEFASRVLANKEDYSPAMVKKANFARNASRWKKPAGGVVSVNGNVKNGLIYTGRLKARGGIGINLEEAEKNRGARNAGERPSMIGRIYRLLTENYNDNPYMVTGYAPAVGLAGNVSGSRYWANVAKKAQANIKRVNTRIVNGTATDKMLESAIQSEQDYLQAIKNGENMVERVGTRPTLTTTRGGNFVARRYEGVNPNNLPALTNNGFYTPNYVTGTQVANAAKQRAVLRAQARANKAAANANIEKANEAKRIEAAQKRARTVADKKAAEAARVEAENLRQQRLKIIAEENKQQAAEKVNNNINMRQAAYDQAAVDNLILDRLRTGRSVTDDINSFNRTFTPVAYYTLGSTAPAIIGYEHDIKPLLNTNENEQNVNAGEQLSEYDNNKRRAFIQNSVDDFKNRIERISNDTYNPNNSKIDDLLEELQNLDGTEETPFKQDKIILIPDVASFNVTTPTIGIDRGTTELPSGLGIKRRASFMKKAGGAVRPKAEEGKWLQGNLYKNQLGYIQLGTRPIRNVLKQQPASADNVYRKVVHDKFGNPLTDNDGNYIHIDSYIPEVVRRDTANVMGSGLLGTGNTYLNDRTFNVPTKLPNVENVQTAAQQMQGNDTNTSGGFINKYGDAIASGIGALGSIGSFLISNSNLNRNKPIYTPIRLNAQKLKTIYNINPQLDTLREEANANNRLIANNTASTRNMLGRINLVNAGLARANAELYGTKENKETELINQDILNSQNVANQEAAYNAQLRASYNDRLDDWNRLKLANNRALFAGLSGAVNNYLLNRRLERQFNNTAKTIQARDMDVNAKILRDAGVDYDTLLDYYLRNRKGV